MLYAPSQICKVRNESWFNRESFLAANDPKSRPLLTHLLETQMFSYFEQKRSESSDPK